MLTKTENENLNKTTHSPNKVADVRYGEPKDDIIIYVLTAKTKTSMWDL